MNNEIYDTIEEATIAAEKLTEKTGELHIASEYGTGNYTAFRMPAVGDKVSYAFNGDYRPCGEIVKITPTWRITTSDGTKFFRNSEKSWKKGSKNGTFSLVKGHIDERNPSF